MPLEVHHLTYAAGCEPWEYPLENFQTLCRDCHQAAHIVQLPNPPPKKVAGAFYAWHQLRLVVGHAPHGYLTEIEGNIVCGCFRLDLNPDAPDIILPGTRDDWMSKASRFERQATAAPVFLKAEGLPWEYAGNYRVESSTSNLAEIAIHRERVGRNDIGLVLFLSQV